MGGSPSNLFFPGTLLSLCSTKTLKILTQAHVDNPHRRDRAQQLANDCQSAQYTYKQTRAQIAAALAPSRAKLQPVLKALGCVTLEDLDQKVCASLVLAARARS